MKKLFASDYFFNSLFHSNVTHFFQSNQHLKIVVITQHIQNCVRHQPLGRQNQYSNNPRVLINSHVISFKLQHIWFVTQSPVSKPWESFCDKQFNISKNHCHSIVLYIAPFPAHVVSIRGININLFTLLNSRLIFIINVQLHHPKFLSCAAIPRKS